ncbi:MAG: recombinase family protein [Planctomycetaceae bacterium]|nr:recombinase family protein [Planctomycetaceae bacterium]
MPTVLLPRRRSRPAVRPQARPPSGRKSDRPRRALAVAHAKRGGATLLLAKLDRLARNVPFLSGLMESGVDFIACDHPHANRLTVPRLSAVAENEIRFDAPSDPRSPDPRGHRRWIPRWFRQNPAISSTLGAELGASTSVCSV